VQASLHASLPPPPPPSHFYVAESCAPTCAEPNRDPGGLGAPVGLTVPLAAHCPWSLLLRCSPLHFLHPSSLPSPHVRPSSTRSQARVECRSRFTSREGYMSPPGVADRVQRRARRWAAVQPVSRAPLLLGGRLCLAPPPAGRRARHVQKLRGGAVASQPSRQRTRLSQQGPPMSIGRPV